ncbi:MAG: AGE family epimerase/isomerase [Phenylobacterium sp.]|uniref:AGE family epimerase/isomerase n=1 Tax=Phenylobacterium sp. TaxID=1871053 RepID=UPI002735C0CE|nr:AGE family epimerase/isomerase [Phenylobacterium sp.]MDP3748421.1 AGE family epimerase/isomerase [Phenylobacterium sp.]
MAVDSIVGQAPERGEGAHFRAFADLAQAADWYDRWLRREALPLWWNIGADRARGGFFEGLSVDGRPHAAARRCRVQGRQVFVYATAGALGWDGPWREAAWHGMDFLQESFLRPDGLFRTLVGLDGAVLDDTPMLYDQAFALLGTATLHQADPRGGEMVELARGVRQGLEAMRHPAGGYRENIAYPFQANAHMHLLEGAMAWAELEGGDWEAMVDEIVEMALEVFIDPKGGFLREFFDADWRLTDGDDGRLVEPGHQFEWAWLMDRHAKRRGDARAAGAASGLYAAGRRGIDPVRQVAVNELWDDFSLRDATARLWPQTEHLKATLLLGGEADALSAAQSLRRYLETPTPGAWRDKLRPDGAFIEEPAPATSFYHILGACLELFKATGR